MMGNHVHGLLLAPKEISYGQTILENDNMILHCLYSALTWAVTCYSLRFFLYFGLALLRKNFQAEIFYQPIV